jgi:phosphate acetyltransferase
MLYSGSYVCPQGLLDKAKAFRAVRTVVVGAAEALTLESAKQAAEEGLINPILVGEKEKIARLANELDWDISGVEIADCSGEQEIAAKGIGFASSGEASLIMKGHIHTDSLLRAVLNKEAGLRIGKRLSHVFHMSVPDSDRDFLISDAALNVAPDRTTMLDIVRNSVLTAQALGTEAPKVACLTASESVSTAMPLTEEAAWLAEQDFGSAVVGGPFAFDNAVSADAAKIKGIDHPVAGNADVLIVPNIECGNMLFKSMVYLRGATAAGLVLGAKVPVIVTSRADPPAARLASVALAAVVSNHAA